MLALSEDDKKVITAVGVEVGFGCEVLDDDGNVTATLNGGTPERDKVSGQITSVPDGAEIVGGTVRHNAYDPVPGTCELQLTRELDWPNIWLRPYQTVTAFGRTVTAPAGVFRPTMPELPMGGAPLIWTVSGADRLSLLQDKMDDSQVSPAGESVLSEITRAITAAAVPGRILPDSTAAATLLTYDMVWALDASDPDSYLRWCNDLAAAVAYRALWADLNGDFRVEQYRPPQERPASWLFDLTDPATDIMRVDRTSRTDGWTPYNAWRFVRQNLPYEPVVGDGVYEIAPPAGVRPVWRIAQLAAADQASLVAQGDQIADTDRQRIQTVEYKAVGFVGAEHFDVYDVIDPQLRAGVRQHMQCRSTVLDLPSGGVTLTLEVPSG